jgi:acetylornithine deacetylase/succinyl-diaminopimelate desuccinylase-like protein
MTTVHPQFDAATADARIEDLWTTEIVDELCRYITIPALSPAFDPEWETNGHLDRAVDQIEAWMGKRTIAGMSVERRSLPGRTPILLVDIPAFPASGSGEHDQAGEPTVLLYGHLDKQPEMVGWRDDLGPWKPVREGDLLYGRGGADDGYAAYASLAAIEALQEAGGQHPRLLVLIEASEESGSVDLPAHLEALGPRLGQVELVICLDSGCADYERLWLTTSLRGMVGLTVTAEVVAEGLHSGQASGIVPSTFRVLRQLLDRIESAETGRVLVESASVDIPAHRVDEAQAMADLVGDEVFDEFPFLDGVRPMTDDRTEALLNRTWRPTVSYIGADGLPPTGQAGNVLRPASSLKLSLRLPPTADSQQVLDDVTAALTSDAPYGAKVSVSESETADGWDAPDLAPWLRTAIDGACHEVFGQSMQLYGVGGSIPFIGMLGQRFPEAQFLITGVLGPASNAHGPNEFLHVPFAHDLTRCLARVLAAAGAR